MTTDATVAAVEVRPVVGHTGAEITGTLWVAQPSLFTSPARPALVKPVSAMSDASRVFRSLSTVLAGFLSLWSTSRRWRGSAGGAANRGTAQPDAIATSRTTAHPDA